MKDIFLTDKIITYIGNKRKLLSFIEEAVNDVISNDSLLSTKQAQEISFFDIFSGSGVVARWAKTAGYKVYTNDLEVYSKVIGDAFIGTNKNEVDYIFSDLYHQMFSTPAQEGRSYDDILRILNSAALFYVENEYLPVDLSFFAGEQTPSELPLNYTKENIAYFSDHYAPKSMNNDDVDFANERLFYTQRNARFIDAIIFILNNELAFQTNKKAHNIVLAELLYYMSVHNNTSGVMKGFHNGWGGKSEAALERIMKPFILEGIHLIDGVAGLSFTSKAEEVFLNEPVLTGDNIPVDIIYADPPYNQHQYSANYHLLTSAVKNDKLDPGPVVQGGRAGIRRDHNRSGFSASSKKDSETSQNYMIDGHPVRSVEYSFWKFIKSLEGKAKYLIVSYNNEGLLTHDELMTILNNNEKNTVSFRSKTHDKFKGGKNTNVSTKVSEFIFIVQLGRKQSLAKLQKQIEDLHRVTFVDLIEDSAFSIEALRAIDGFTCFEKCDSYHFVDDNNYIFTLDKSLRVKSFNKEGFTLDNIASIQSCRIEKENLIEFYLSDIEMYQYNKDEIPNLLKSLKIKKYQDYLPKLQKKIADFEMLVNENQY